MFSKSILVTALYAASSLRLATAISFVPFNGDGLMRRAQNDSEEDYCRSHLKPAQVAQLIGACGSGDDGYCLLCNPQKPGSGNDDTEGFPPCVDDAEKADLCRKCPESSSCPNAPKPAPGTPSPPNGHPPQNSPQDPPQDPPQNGGKPPSADPNNVTNPPPPAPKAPGSGNPTPGSGKSGSGEGGSGGSGSGQGQEGSSNASPPKNGQAPTKDKRPSSKNSPS